jgi:energy-coupling factor transporter ATP-binding protein EcfA2
VVLITHHMEETIHADRLIVMDNGRIVMDGARRRFSPGGGAERLRP